MEVQSSLLGLYAVWQEYQHMGRTYCLYDRDKFRMLL